MLPSRRVFVLAAAVSALSCGASIQAVYEGDVRFEHCMALDARPDVKPTIRRGCWEEWVRFYTFGQTRDRIDHARLRQRQLSAASDFDESELAPVVRAGAVPDPTSALAPPPMMMITDGGAPGAARGVPDASVEERPTPPGADCTAECEQGLELCRRDCKSGPCEKGCTGKYKRCMRRCF